MAIHSPINSTLLCATEWLWLSIISFRETRWRRTTPRCSEYAWFEDTSECGVVRLYLLCQFKLRRVSQCHTSMLPQSWSSTRARSNPMSTESWMTWQWTICRMMTRHLWIMYVHSTPTSLMDVDGWELAEVLRMHQKDSRIDCLLRLFFLHSQITV